MREGGQGGQAAAEAIGVAVMVALLLAAVTAWLLREVRPPDRPPDLIGAVAKPLERGPAPFELRYPLPRPFDMPRGRDDEPIGRALRAAGRGVREAVAFAVEMRHRCALAYGMRLGERSLALVRDPFGELLQTPAADLVTREEIERYVEELRAMPGRDAALRAAEDACALGADGTVDVAQALLRRRIERGVGTSRRS
jgi:hypothetical protein